MTTESTKNYESRNYRVNKQQEYGKYIFIFLKSSELMFQEVHEEAMRSTPMIGCTEV
jgi:hypothetical protein